MYFFFSFAGPSSGDTAAVAAAAVAGREMSTCMLLFNKRHYGKQTGPVT